MPHPLEQKLARLRRRARLYVVLKAASRAILLVVAVTCVLALADVACHFQDRGLRVIFSLALLTATAAGVRWIVRAVRESRYRDVQIAQQVEQFYPELRGRLASAIEFLRDREDDPLAGSAELRRAVISDATANVQRYDLRATLDARPARRAALTAALAIVAVVLLVAIDAPAARIAAIRLVNPLSNVEWPRVNQLAILDPVLRLPQGQDFVVQAVDSSGAPLPDDIAVQYRWENPDGSVTEESEPMQLLGDVARHERSGVHRPFEYRAVGGDDRLMPWQQLEIVESPGVRDSSLTLHFPTYSGWPDRTGELNVHALIGTKIEIRAQATKELESASVRLADEQEIPAALAADGHSLSVPADFEHEFVIKGSGSYWFDLVDREGFHSAASPKYELHAVPDAAPSVEVERPQANIHVASDATLPVSITARDDLAIHRITLNYLRSDKSEEGEQTLEIVAEPEQVSAEVAAASAADGYAGDRRALSYQWELKPLGLDSGTYFTFHATVVDYAGQTAQSLSRRVTVVTPEEIQDRLAERQSVIFNELARVLLLEQTARSHVAGLEVQLDQTGKFHKSDIDVLQGAGLNQQQVERELTSERDGIHGQIEGFLDELTINKIDGPDTHRQMLNVLSELARLSRGPLPDAAHELTSASKAAQVDLQDTSSPDVQPAKQIRTALKAAGRAQDDVVDSLSRVMDDMKQWVNHRHFHREIGQVSKAQEEMADEAAALGRQTLSRAIEDLDPQQRADLQKLAQRQLELARRLERLEQRMDDAVETARQEDPLAADGMTDALAHARSHGIAESMMQSGQNIEQNKIGQAAEGQRRAAEELHELLNILSNRREHELGRLVKKLREAEQKLSTLAAEQRGLAKKLQANQQVDEAQRQRELQRLSRQQEQLQQEAARFARSLARLQANKAGDSVANAGAKMEQGTKSGDAGDNSTAAEQAAAAERDLEEAQQKLAARRQQAEVDLAQEQLARMEDAIASMHERQGSLVGETTHYQQRQVERGHLTRAESISVRELARGQEALRDESQELAKTLAGAEVFQFVLEQAGQEMDRAGARLDRRDVGDETLRAELAALAHIERLQAALSTDPQQPVAEESQDEGEDSSGGGKKPQPKVRSVAELKLLKAVQEEINGRTRALDEGRHQSSSRSDEQQLEYAALSKEQGRLADLIANMIEETAERPEDEPDSLPDVREPSASTADPEHAQEMIP
ncbi:MAG TPA: hypothetical protein VGG64_11185 [Pirellulales bacterium]|jgi:hypothetical protein